MYENIPHGFYNMTSDQETEPTLGHVYYNRDAKCTGIGFNVHDGGGFLPLADLTEDTKLISVSIIPSDDLRSLNIAANKVLDGMPPETN